VTEISDWSDIEAQLQENKELLEEIEQRFLQVRRDSLKQNELQTQQEQIRAQIQKISSDRSDRNKNQKIRRKPNPRNELSTSSPHKEELLKQLEKVGEQLEQIEADLESRLLSWSSFREPFWQIVRFGGIGVIIGVILRSCSS
jgi:hypothetical protein